MKVSVCMAVYNGQKFIEEQLRSILVQLEAEDEVVVSDDGSTDRTIEIVKNIGDSRIRVVSSEGKNIIKNFENALSKATGDIIFLSDQDDIWFPDKVVLCKEQLKKCDLVISNLSVFADDISEGSPFFQENERVTGFWNNLVKNHYVGAAMAFRRSLLEKAIPFPEQIYMHDVWLGILAEIYCKTCYIPKPLVYYRRHGDNASETGEKSSNSLLKKLDMRIKLVVALLKRVLKWG